MCPDKCGALCAGNPFSSPDHPSSRQPARERVLAVCLIHAVLMSVMPLASSSSGTPTAGLFQNLSTGAVGVVALAVNGRGRTCITTHVVPNAALVCGAAPRAAARSRVTVLAPAHTLQESIALPVYGRRSNAPCSKTIIMLLTTGQVPHAARRDSPFTYEHACMYASFLGQR